MILNAIRDILKKPEVSRKMFGRKKAMIWENISNGVNALNANKTEETKWHFDLPGNWRRLKGRYERYIAEGYTSFIHKNEGNEHSTIIKGDIAEFLLAQYCLPIKLTIPELLMKYEAERVDKDWDSLSEQAIFQFLNKPENERIWTLARDGKESWEKKYKHTMGKEKKNWFPNVYWAMDGTKLDWTHHWEDSSNKMGAKVKINVMFDVYSEKIIGWSISFSETHTDHFKVIKMAVNNSQCRPYFLTYDNQSGHKMKRMQDLYSSLVAANKGTHYPHKAYGHSNPAEQLFNRLQQQVISKFWFSDKQGVKVRRVQNAANFDFIEENKHQLHTTEQLEQAWEYAVKMWNEAKHPHFEQSRNEVYKHQMPIKESLDILEIMDKMWITQTERPITYKANGLTMQIGDIKHRFEVRDSQDNIDLEFRRKNVGKKFFVRYDPEFLTDGYIQLLEVSPKNELIHIANAQPAKLQEVVPVLMQEDDKAQFAKDYQVRNLEFERDKKAYEDLVAKTGISRQQMIDDQELAIKTKGRMPKRERELVESNYSHLL
jgi:hypothetical protein